MHVTGSLTRNVYCDRLKGYQRALSQFNLPFKNEMLIVNDLGERAGVQVAEQVLAMRNKPDGLFIAGDLCATICMQKLTEAGIKIPEDIAIIGFNDDLISRVVTPKLSTVQYNGREMGMAAAKSLLEQLSIDKKISSDYVKILRHQLIIRDSSRKVTAKHIP